MERFWTGRTLDTLRTVEYELQVSTSSHASGVLKSPACHWHPGRPALARRSGRKQSLDTDWVRRDCFVAYAASEWQQRNLVMKVTGLEVLRCDAGWRNYYFLKLSTDGGITGWSEFDEGFGSPGITAVIDHLAGRVVAQHASHH